MPRVPSLSITTLCLAAWQEPFSPPHPSSALNALTHWKREPRVPGAAWPCEPCPAHTKLTPLRRKRLKLSKCLLSPLPLRLPVFNKDATGMLRCHPQPAPFKKSSARKARAGSQWFYLDFEPASPPFSPTGQRQRSISLHWSDYTEVVPQPEAQLAQDPFPGRAKNTDM